MRYKSVNKGALCGFADLYDSTSDLEIFGCAVFRKDSRIWVTMPCKEALDTNGLKRYYSHLKFRDKSRMEFFSQEAVKAIIPKMDASRDEHPINLEACPF